MKKRIFAEKTRVDCLLLLHQDATPPNCTEKNLAKDHKINRKFAEVSCLPRLKFIQAIHVRSGAVNPAWGMRLYIYGYTCTHLPT